MAGFLSFASEFSAATVDTRARALYYRVPHEIRQPVCAAAPWMILSNVPAPVLCAAPCDLADQPGVKGFMFFNTLKEEKTVERTFAIIKPDAFAAGHAGRILTCIYEAGFTVVGMKKIWLSEVQAGGFYHVHRDRPFFADLTAFMSSGPCVALVLEAPGAIARWRERMGATDPGTAAAGTLRREFGTSIGCNALHGSDAPDTAAFEIGYFFSGMELL